jgi:hypothetical protein
MFEPPKKEKREKKRKKRESQGNGLLGPGPYTR